MLRIQTTDHRNDHIEPEGAVGRERVQDLFSCFHFIQQEPARAIQIQPDAGLTERESIGQAGVRWSDADVGHHDLIVCEQLGLENERNDLVFAQNDQVVRALGGPAGHHTPAVAHITYFVGVRRPWLRDRGFAAEPIDELNRRFLFADEREQRRRGGREQRTEINAMGRVRVHDAKRQVQRHDLPLLGVIAGQTHLEIVHIVAIVGIHPDDPSHLTGFRHLEERHPSVLVPGFHTGGDALHRKR